LNLHKLIITGIMVAAKFYDDDFYDNGYYAKIGGIPLEEINNMELEYLCLLNFRLLVESGLFLKYYQEMYSNYMANSYISTVSTTSSRGAH
jgi:hypothetical protein